MTRWRGTNCWNAWWTQIVFARKRRPQWGWHLYVAESAVLYLKYFIPCCQCPRLALARGRRRGASDFATFVGKRETRRKNAVVGRRFQCLHRTCWGPWSHWFSRTMRNGEQKPARNPGEDARPLLGDLPAQHPEAATAASRLGHDLAFLYGLSFLDFLRWISSSWIPARWIWGNSGDLQQQKGARKKKCRNGLAWSRCGHWTRPPLCSLHVTLFCAKEDAKTCTPINDRVTPPPGRKSTTCAISCRNSRMQAWSQ